MTVTSSSGPKALVLRVSGRLDATTAARFEEACRASIGPEVRNVVLDFAGVEYLSSAGVRAVLVLGKTVQGAGGTLVFSGLRGAAGTILEMSGFSKLFPVSKSVEAALDLL